MTKKNSAYWQERFVLLEEALNRDVQKLLPEIDRIYKRAQREIERDILSWHRRVAKNNEVSMAEARKMLDSRELEEFRWTLAEYIKHGEENAIDQRWMKQLENASARYHISKLEALKLQVQQSLEVIHGNQLDLLDDAMRKQYQEGYFRTAFEVQKGFDVGFPIASIDEKKLEKVIKKPWAPDGSNFSDRVWKNKGKLVNELHTELTRMCITGDSPDTAIKNIASKLNTSRYNAGRLVMTEAAYFGSAAQKDSFMELGVQQYKILATLDFKTSKICRDLDGRVFDMKDYEAGVTAPPFHVFCRTTTVPYFNDEFTAREMRVARGKDGKAYHVPAEMKYEEWKKAFVDGIGMNAPQLLYPLIYDKLSKTIQGSYEEELSKVPEEHLVIMDGGIDEIEIIEEGASRFDRENRTLYILRNFEPGELIHELAHVLETELGLYEDDVFVKVLRHGLYDFESKIIYDPETFVKPVIRLINEKFVTKYQGRLYDELGLYNEKRELNHWALGEYFSEGYKIYLLDPQELKKKDPKLFDYIERMLDDAN